MPTVVVRATATAVDDRVRVNDSRRPNRFEPFCRVSFVRIEVPLRQRKYERYVDGIFGQQDNDVRANIAMKQSRYKWLS